jgi:hypothetical protein
MCRPMPLGQPTLVPLTVEQFKQGEFGSLAIFGPETPGG